MALLFDKTQNERTNPAATGTNQP